MKPQILLKEDLPLLYESLKKKNKVFSVMEKGKGKCVFAETDTFSDPLDAYTPTLLPPKKYLLPQQETLFCFRMGASPSVEENVDVEPQVIFGVRPCDIHAISLLDKTFSLENAENRYLDRRKQTIIVGIDCLHHCDTYSFCETVGTLDVKEGFDILLTDMQSVIPSEAKESHIVEKFFITVGTKKGEEILKEFGKTRDASDAEVEQFNKIHEARKRAFEYRFKTEVANLPLVLAGANEDVTWKELEEICLGCGSCNIVCPTCYCFDVFDNVDLSLNGGERCRQWDACTLKDFAVVATGENFRKSRANRLRHRFNRKFNYLMTKYGQPNCVGCGRCSKVCLVKIDTVDVVNRLIKNKGIGNRE
ncbi:MAG TPA: 4Fe-4S dicluster domain-containing protein [Candidatus Brocadiia bacterium]|nr:4Fe-4S dicluster domain-containing protein [Planctomycetota bacterium]MDO8092044.1 4Fe-4S dicluster domain-containing protein [Candidatus Brocadiales bacterium]